MEKSNITCHMLSFEAPVILNLTGKFQAPDPNWQHMDRILSDYELIIITEGQLHIVINDLKYDVMKGHYLLIAPDSHIYGYKSSECAFYWMHFTTSEQAIPIITTSSPYPKILYGNAPEAIPLAYPLSYPEFGWLENTERLILIMKQLHDTMRHHNISNLNNYSATSLLLELYGQIRTMETKDLITHSSGNQTLYNDIKDYVRWHIYEPISVGQIADHFGYNEKYLSHLYKQLDGQALKHFILTEKMAIAKSMLLDSQASVKNIAATLGYTDHQHFMKTFKRLVGITPTSFRNTYHQRLLYYK